MHLVKLRTIVGDPIFNGQVHLTNQDPLGKRIDHRTQLTDHIVNLGLMLIVDASQTVLRHLCRGPGWIGWVIGEIGMLDQHPDHIDTEAINTAGEPEAHHIVDRSAYRRVAPVEIGLLGVEQMEVVLTRSLIKAPGRATKIAQPVIWRPPVSGRVTPDIPVAERTRARGACLHKPGVLIRGVVGYQVEDQPHAAGMQCAQQTVKIGE